MTEADREEIAALVQFAFFRPHLAALLTACAGAKLDVIVLKGAALAETVYPRPSLRRFGDLDVLIRHAEAARARPLLESLGYVVDSLAWADLMGGRGCQANFFKHAERGAVVVELHTELVNNDLFFGQVHAATEGVWERARTVRLAGTQARALGPEDQVLHLCLHLAGHLLATPQSLRDIAQVCAVERVDWLLLVRLAQSARAAPTCFAALYAAVRLLGVSVPPSVLDALAPRAGRRALERLAAARANDRAGTRTEPLRGPLLWHLLGSFPARVTALGRILFPSRRWLARHYTALFDDPAGPLPPGLSPRCLRQMAAVTQAHAAFLLRRLCQRG